MFLPLNYGISSFELRSNFPSATVFLPLNYGHFPSTTVIASLQLRSSTAEFPLNYGQILPGEVNISLQMRALFPYNYGVYFPSTTDKASLQLRLKILKPLL